MMKQSVNYDAYGVKYQHPNRTCSKCKLFPCRDDMKILDVDFAKYGCINYT